MTPCSLRLGIEDGATMKESSMSSHPTDFQGSVIDALREAIEEQIPNSRAEINGAGGHFNIEVISPVFAGKGMLESQRLVYGWS